MSALEDKFIELWEMKFNHIDLYREFMFAKSLGRRHRADFASIEAKVIIEIQGGIYQGNRKGGHISISGITGDYEKMCLAAQLGYLLFPLYDKTITIPQLQIIADTIVARSSKSSYANIMKQIA